MGSIVLRGRCKIKIKRCILLNFKKIYHSSVCIILGLLRQKNNSSYIALIKFGSGVLTYISAVHGTLPGDFRYLIFFRRLNFKKFLKAGTKTFVKFLTNKTVFCQIIFKNDKFSKYIRAAGTYTRLYQRYLDKKMISCRLPTKTVKFLSYNSLITIGRNSNIKAKKEFLTIAGMNIKKGFKSKVRGVAMNPVDHPHGGRTKTSSPEKSP